MKSMTTTIIALLLCAALPAQEIDGWKIATGKWSQEGDDIRTTAGGVLICEAKAKKGFQLKCRITVHEWLGTPEQSNACIFWAFKGSTGDQPDWLNRHVLAIKPDFLYVAGPGGTGQQRHDVKLPLGNPVNVTIKALPRGAEVTIGKIRMISHVPYTDPNKIALVVTTARVTYEKIKLTMR